MNTTKILVTSSIFNDVTIFYDIKKKKIKKKWKKEKEKMWRTGYFFLSYKFRGHVDKGGIWSLTYIALR